MAAFAYLLGTTQLLLAADVTNISVSASPNWVSAAGGAATISASVSDGAKPYHGEHGAHHTIVRWTAADTSDWPARPLEIWL